MKSKPKILIVTPTSSHKDYCLEEWSKSIRDLTYNNLDMLIIDNSDDKNHVDYIKTFKFRDKTAVVHLPKTKEHKDIRYIMKDCNNLGNYIATQNNYDYILSIESDVFAPCKNAVEILLSHNKEVVGFNYFISEYHKSVPVTFRLASETTTIINNVQSNWRSAFILHDGKLKKVPNLGLGFLLIKNTVFTQIPFRIDDNWIIDCENFAHADTFFHIDLQKKGIDIWCDTKHICEHKNKSWRKILNNN